MTATSAFASASERAAFTQPGWLSGTTPLPMAVARKGSPAAATSSVSCLSARENAAPLPMTTSGLFGNKSQWLPFGH